MAEIKHTFTQGRMNKDLDDRLVPNGEYIDALNIQVSASEGSDVGAIENILGNEKLSDINLINAKTIGSIADTKNNKLFWLVTSDLIDAIYEFDEITKEVKPILLDEKETNIDVIKDLGIKQSKEGELILTYDPVLEQVIGNTINQNDDGQTLVENNFDLSVTQPEIKLSIPKNTVILKEDGEYIFKNITYNNKDYSSVDITFTYTTKGFLNFSKNNLVTGINIIDGLLFWTDNLNQPRRINISEFSNYKIVGNQTQINGRAITEDDVSVIKKAPKKAPTMVIKDTNLGGNTSASLDIDFENKSAGDKITLTNVTGKPNWKKGDLLKFVAEEEETIIEGTIDLIYGPVDARQVDIIINNITTEDPINSSLKYIVTLIEKDPIYELTFVRFAYRWKYKNGEYSVFSPFTQVAFYPFLEYFRYDGKEAFNYGMVNQTRNIELSDFDLGSDEVVEIDILFKETRNNNIYNLVTKKTKDFNNVFVINKEQIHSVIENTQLLRQWDNVPKKAKAQEVTGNRIIYGNYTQNYDIYKDPEFDVKYKPYASNLKTTIKSNRNYQLGVVYSDDYNRQTPVLSNETGALFVPKNESINNNRICVNLNNEPPAWATHYRYFIKETSGEYYNLAADRIYNDEENGFSYISFPSGERNKVTEEHYLLLKKNHGDNQPCTFENNRYKIIDISAEPPEFITARKKAVISFADVVFTDDYSGSGGGATITNKSDAENNAPVKDFASIQIKQVNGSSDGVPLDDAKEVKAGRYISFEYLGKESKLYKIKRLSQHPSGDNEIKIDFEDPFQEDVHIIYNKSSGNLGDAGTNFGVNVTIHEEFSAAGDKEFDGRFFVKIKTNTALIESIIKQTVGGIEYLAKASNNLIGVYSKNEPEGTGRNGSNTYENANRGKTNAAGKHDEDPRNHFVVGFGGSKVPGSTPETGERIVVGSLEYNITLEAATRFMNSKVDKLAKLAKVGNFVRFTNQDNTLHHDTIYEIGQVLVEDFRRGFGGTNRRDYKRISFRFIDEDGNFKPLDETVCTRGDDTWEEEIQMEILQEIDDEQTIVKDPAIFETEPLESKTELNIYFEASDIIDIDKHNTELDLNWYNAISFNNGVESNRIRDDFNAVFIDNGVKASTVLDQPFLEEHKFNGLIFSGIINSRSGVNKTNEFNMANPITKDFLPIYGSIQKLHAWDDSLVVLCEDKTLRVLASKSALYNADGSSNLISDSRVLGDPIEYNGDYGISNNPESFAAHGFRCYFADRKRGSILRLSKNGLTPISSNFMGSFFRNRLFSSGLFRGSYDPRNGLYNISFDDQDTICFSEDTNGWVSRLSFIPENSVYLNNIYYTYRLGELWQHYSNNSLFNNFYDVQYPSFVELVINDNPSVIKKFKTLGYEGTNGWVAKTLKTDQVIGNETAFTEKENKYFANITQESKNINTLDNKNFSTQGIGRSIAAGAPDYIIQVGAKTIDKFNVKVEDGTSWSSQQKNDIEIKQDKSIDDIEIRLIAGSSYLINKTLFTHSSSLITFDNDNDDVIVKISGKYLESLNPVNGQTITITLTGKILLKPVTVSGNYSITGFNFTDDVGNGTFTITNDPGTEQIIKQRKVSPDSGFTLIKQNISIDNSLINLKLTNNNGSVDVIESITIPTVDTINQNYVLTVDPQEIYIAPPKLLSSKLDTSAISNDGENRILQIIGEAGAECEVIFSDASSVIKTETIIFGTDVENVDLDFPAGDSALNFTVKINTKGDTEFDANFGTETYTLSRPLRTLQYITLIINPNNLLLSSAASALKNVEVTGYAADKADFDFKLTTTLNGTGYSVVKTPVFNDLQFSTNTTGTNIVFSNFVITTATNDTLAIEGKITSDNMASSETFFLELQNIIQKNVTLTFAYSNTTASGTATTNYSTTGYLGASVPYTITAPSNKIYSLSRNYFFTLNAASNYEPKTTFTNTQPFRLYDSSNNDVTTTYTDRVQFGTRTSGTSNEISVGFKNIAFKMPSSNQTITIRPVEQLFQATTGVKTHLLITMPIQLKSSGFTRQNGNSSQEIGANSSRIVSVIDSIASNIQGITSISNFPNHRVETKAGWYVQSDIDTGGYRAGNWHVSDASNQVRLIQNILTLPDILWYWWDAGITDTNKFNVTFPDSGSFISKATAGSYTDIYGDTKSITGPFELSSDRKTLTINIKYNFGGTSPGSWITYKPSLVATLNNDFPNYFTEYKVKVGNTITHRNNPCSIPIDKNIQTKIMYSPDSKLIDGSVLFSRDKNNNMRYQSEDYYAFSIEGYDKLADPIAVNYNKQPSKYSSRGNFATLQQSNKITFKKDACPDPNRPKVKYSYAYGNQKLVSSLGGFMHASKIGIVADRSLANQKIKITGTYVDLRYESPLQIPDNKTLANTGTLNIVTTTNYTNGVPPTKAIENMHIEGFKITDTTKNTWEAEVQLDYVGRGILNFKVQVYSNITANGLYFKTDQITGVPQKVFTAFALYGMKAQQPTPIFKYNRTTNRREFEKFQAYTDFPENSNYPSMYSISVGDIAPVVSSQWATPYTGKMTKLNINE